MDGTMGLCVVVEVVTVVGHGAAVRGCCDEAVLMMKALMRCSCCCDEADAVMLCDGLPNGRHNSRIDLRFLSLRATEHGLIAPPDIVGYVSILLMPKHQALHSLGSTEVIHVNSQHHRVLWSSVPSRHRNQLAWDEGTGRD